MLKHGGSLVVDSLNPCDCMARMRDEAATHVANCEKMPWIRRVAFKDFSQPQDELIRRACLNVARHPPDFFEQLLPWHQSALVFDEILEQFPLSLCELDRLSLDR